MEVALLCWIAVSIGCAFVLSHTAHEHDKGEFRWFMCGLVMGLFALVFLSYLRRTPGEAGVTHAGDPGFDASHATPALDDPASSSR